MNGLEALKRIRQETAPNTYCKDFDKNECCDIIEKELNALKIIKDKAMILLNLEEEDWDVWDNGIRTGEVVHKYLVYDNERDEHIELTKDEFDLLREVLG